MIMMKRWLTLGLLAALVTGVGMGGASAFAEGCQCKPCHCGKPCPCK